MRRTTGGWRGPDVARKRRTTAFRLWVRERLRCLICSAAYPDPHHVRQKGMGGVQDEEAIDESNVVPLCRMCHDKGHFGGWLKLVDGGKLHLQREAVRVWERWLSVTDEEREHYQRLAKWRHGD